MKKIEVLKKAKDIIKKRNKEMGHTNVCLEAGICPKCGATLESMLIAHFWSYDEDLTRCSVNPDHYENLDPIIH